MLFARPSLICSRRVFKLVKNPRRFASADHKFGKDFTLKGFLTPIVEIYHTMHVHSQHKTFVPICIILSIAWPYAAEWDRKVFAEEYSQFFNKTRMYGKHEYHKGEVYKHPQFPWLEDEQGECYADEYDD